MTPSATGIPGLLNYSVFLYLSIDQHLSSMMVSFTSITSCYYKRKSETIVKELHSVDDFTSYIDFGPLEKVIFTFNLVRRHVVALPSLFFYDAIR